MAAQEFGVAGAGPTKRAGTWLALPCLLLALAACKTVPDGAAPYEPNASMGMVIARDHCASCHELSRSTESPNSRAPSFRDIVNRPGMTPEALAGWLKNGHNYPTEMGFHLEPQRVDSLVAYMIRQRAEEPASQE